VLLLTREAAERCQLLNTSICSIQLWHSLRQPSSTHRAASLASEPYQLSPAAFLVSTSIMRLPKLRLTHQPSPPPSDDKRSPAFGMENHPPPQPVMYGNGHTSTPLPPPPSDDLRSPAFGMGDHPPPQPVAYGKGHAPPPPPPGYPSKGMHAAEYHGQHPPPPPGYPGYPGQAPAWQMGADGYGPHGPSEHNRSRNMWRNIAAVLGACICLDILF
jgi:hypothetical protein